MVGGALRDVTTDLILNLYSATPDDLRRFLGRNPEFGLELVYLKANIIEKITNGEKLNLFDPILENNPFTPFEGGIPTLIDKYPDFIKIRITIYE